MSDKEKRYNLQVHVYCCVCLNKKPWHREVNGTCGKERCLSVFRRVRDRIVKP